MRRLALAALPILLLAASPARVGERQRAEHALNRLAFGARPGDVDRIVQLGVDRWIDRQLHPERIDDSLVEARLAPYATLSYSDSDMVREFYRPLVQARREKKKDGEAVDDPAMRELRQKARRVVGELSAQRILRAADSERQLNEVMVDFWFNHFNVFAGKGVDRFLLTGYERDVIRPHIWGRFDDLVMATAKSPAMLFYLDNARSRASGLNENYARELMELHTLGVDGGYAQKDVTELARVFTGWSISRPQEGETHFVFRRPLHDRGAKTVLGVKLPAGGGMEEGERMIRFLARQPATAHHIAYQLAQRLVADDPPPALVDRVAKRFLATGGDLRATVKAVIDSPEFWDPQSYGKKVKSPFEYAISAIRAVGGQISDPLPLARELQKIGEPLYFAQPPTGYSDKSEAWMNAGAMMNRVNFAIALSAGKMPGVQVKPSDAALKLSSPEFQRQ